MTDEGATPAERLLEKAARMLAGAKNAFGAGFYEDAVSRAYYAAFHAVSATLAVKKLSFSSHGQTLGAFNREIVFPGLVPKDSFRRLQKLFADRHIGDYSAIKIIDRTNAETNIAEAEQLLSHCKQMVASMNLPSAPPSR